MKTIIQFFFLGVFVSMGYLCWQVATFMLLPPSESTQIVDFQVRPGASFSKISQELLDEGLITDMFKLKVVASVMGYAGKMRVGEYELHPNMTPLQILKIISSGKSKTYSLTFQEGINMYEIAEILESKGLISKSDFLKWCKDPQFIRNLLKEEPSSLEGYLFPETYIITRFTGAKELIRLMVDNFNKNYDLAKAGATVDLDRHHAVILASLVEKETGAPEERPLISSVFHNRLQKKMRLQSDPTILYGILNQTGELKSNITKKDILAPTPYNTYTVRGLPKGPISNPGKASIWAAFHPKSSSYLYFVSRNDGTHVFTTNYEDHSRAVRKFQLDSKMREGKSWRDLNKNR